jgi:anaerobic magnesium-protoporphyrin IX monomethyl ester cyclase
VSSSLPRRTAGCPEEATDLLPHAPREQPTTAARGSSVRKAGQASAERTERAISAIDKFGRVVRSMHVPLGQCDLVILAEVPGVQDALNASVALRRSMGISFSTSEAVSVEEFDELAAEAWRCRVPAGRCSGGLAAVGRRRGTVAERRARGLRRRSPPARSSSIRNAQGTSRRDEGREHQRLESRGGASSTGPLDSDAVGVPQILASPFRPLESDLKYVASPAITEWATRDLLAGPAPPVRNSKGRIRGGPGPREEFMKKVLFITPPYHCGVVEVAGRWIPLHLVYLAGSAREAGFDCEIYDAMSLDASHRDIARVIETTRPDLVATSCIPSTYPDGLEIMRSAKALGARTLMGGVHPSFMWREVLDEEGHPVDFVVRGEGEQTLVNLLTALRDGGDLASVRGIAFRENGSAGATPRRPRRPKLDGLPLAWDLLDWPTYTYFVYPGSRLGAISTSRGCMHGCTFCSQQKFWEQSWRGRSPEDVVEELAQLRREHGVDVILLSDEYPTPDARRWERFLDLVIERDLGQKLLLETRVDDVVRDERILEKYVAAGVAHVYVGVEATDQETLDLVNKDASVETGVKALRLLHDYGMVSETSFVLGFPDETPEKIRRTLELAKTYDPDNAHFLAITPWPYANLWAEMEPYIATRDYRKYNLIDPVIRPKAMSLDDVDNAIIDCYRSFYTSKALSVFTDKDTHRRDYMLRAMKLIMGSSFVRKKMSAGKGMPPEIRALLKKIGIVGVEEEARRLCPYAVELDAEDDRPAGAGLAVGGETGL